MQTREERLAKQKAWRDANKERALAATKAWRAKNKEHLANYDRSYRQGNEAYWQKKRETDRKYFHAVTKVDPIKYAKAKAARLTHDLANPEMHAARVAKYRESHRVTLAEKARAAYQAKTVEQRKELARSKRAYLRQYAADHAEAIKENGRLYRSKPEIVERRNARWPEYYANNKLQYIKRANLRRSLLTGDYAQKDLDALYVQQNSKCPGCKKPLRGKYEIDHVMPLFLDPLGDVLTNLQLLCMPCNRRKHAKHPAKWAAEMGRLFA